MEKRNYINRKQESGQAILLVAMLMIVLLGMLGLAIDGGGMMLLYRDAQNATDAAAFAAAYSLCTNGDFEANARESARLNGFVHNTDGANIYIENPPTSGDFAGNDNYVYIGIEAEKPSYFIQLIYPSPLMVRTSATTICNPRGDFGWPENSAVVSLRQNCSDSSGNGLRVNGNGNFNLIGGGAFINDMGGCDNVKSNGNGSFTAGGYGMCAKGNINNRNGGITAPSGQVEENCDDVPQITNPDPLNLPAPTCGPNRGSLADYDGGNAQPGTYTDFDLRNRDDVNLRTGIYCITGSSAMNGGTLTSDNAGVLIYLMPGSGEFRQTGGTIDIVALRNHSTYQNLMMWADINSSGDLTFRGNGNFGMEGTVYAPSRHCDLAGARRENTILNAQIICFTLDATGNGDLTINFDPSRIYEIPPYIGVIN